VHSTPRLRTYLAENEGAGGVVSIGCSVGFSRGPRSAQTTDDSSLLGLNAGSLRKLGFVVMVLSAGRSIPLSLLRQTSDSCGEYVSFITMAFFHLLKRTPISASQLLTMNMPKPITSTIALMTTRNIPKPSPCGSYPSALFKLSFNNKPANNVKKIPHCAPSARTSSSSRINGCYTEYTWIDSNAMSIPQTT
jgi:hypothetical protein